jgi:hypothetical protein
LHHAVPHGGDAQGTGLALPFGQQHPADRDGLIGPLPQCLRDLPQEPFHPERLDCFQCLLVDPGGTPVLADLCPRGLQDLAQRQLVVQRVEAAA